ncbi:hypothetical protein GCM10025794_30090 [Massilia kyonggiensis]
MTRREFAAAGERAASSLADEGVAKCPRTLAMPTAMPANRMLFDVRWVAQ